MPGSAAAPRNTPPRNSYDGKKAQRIPIYPNTTKPKKIKIKIKMVASPSGG